MREDEGGAGDVADLAGAGGDVREGAPAAGDHGESLKPPQEQETRAYDNLIIRYRDAGDTEPVTVTGPLTETDGKYYLHVRLLEA
jgi:hypothetical protein